MALGNADLQRIALKALEQRAGPGPGPKALAVAARLAYDDLAGVSVPLIGRLGVDALTGRALHLAQRSYPWLADPHAPEPPDGRFAQAIRQLEQQDAVLATEAVGAVFATLTGLLVTLIGESLTAKLLRKAWPDAFADSDVKETKP